MYMNNYKGEGEDNRLFFVPATRNLCRSQKMIKDICKPDCHFTFYVGRSTHAWIEKGTKRELVIVFFLYDTPQSKKLAKVEILAGETTVNHEHEEKSKPRKRYEKRCWKISWYGYWLCPARSCTSVLCH